MKSLLFFLIFFSVVSAQTKKINFFGTEFRVNDLCTVKETSINYGKNALIWIDAPPEMMRDMMVSMIKNKIKENNVKEVKTEDLNITLLKKSWKGKFMEYKKEGNDSITNIVQLDGNYNGEARLLILVYKTPKRVGFRIPTYFDFLVK